MKTPLLRLHRQASCRALTLISAAALTLGTANARAPLPRQEAPSAAPQAEVGPAPTIRDTSAMDPALVALLTELIAEVAKEPTSAAARGELGLAYEGNTIWSLAESCYSQAIQLAPDDTQWVFRRGVVRFYNGDLDEAIEDLRATAAVFKNTPVVQARLGDALRIAGELEESEAAWRHAIKAEEKQNPPARYPASRVGLAQVLLDLEQPEEAARLCLEALEIAPGYRHAHYTLGLALLDLGQENEAELELNAGRTAFPEFPPGPHAQRLAAYGRGFSRGMMIIENLVQAGKLPQANILLEAVLLERPDDYMVMNLAARVKMRGGLADQARALLERSLAVAPDQPATFIELCLLELGLANAFSAQLAPLQQAGAVAQQNAQAGQPGAEAQMAQVRAQMAPIQTQGAAVAARALAAATSAVEKAPGVGRHHYWVGVCHQKAAAFNTDQTAAGQSLQAALASFQMAQRLGCTEPSFNQQLASLYGQMGRGRDMLKFALRHLDSNPMDPSALGLVVQAQLSNGLKAEVIPYIKRMEKATNGDIATLQFCVQAYLTIDDYDDAETALGRFEEAAAGNPAAAQFVTAVQDHIRMKRAQLAPVVPPVPPGDAGGGTDDKKTGGQR